jgi:hypothetical protein
MSWLSSQNCVLVSLYALYDAQIELGGTCTSQLWLERVVNPLNNLVTESLYLKLEKNF